METKYKVVNGTSYHKETPDKVIDWLETVRERGTRVRIFCGNKETGECWHEEFDVTGTVGRSMGPVKIPLLINTIRSMGGCGILSHCILAIKSKDGWLYRAKNFKLPEYDIRRINHEIYGYDVYIVNYAKKEAVARFTKKEKAERWVAFMRGERMGK